MSINPLTFGSPIYSPPFSVSSGDIDVMKLRSKETAPLSHESLDENFTNLANKVNQILGLNIDELNITSAGIISASSLGLNSGPGITYSSSTGVFGHQARPAKAAGYENVDISTSNRRFISGLDFDEFGHVVGYQDRTLNFTGSGSVSVNQSSVNQVTISSSAYTSGSSPSFQNIIATGKVGIGTNVSTHTLDIKSTAGTFATHIQASNGKSMGGFYESDNAGMTGALSLYLKDPSETKVRLSASSEISTYFNSGNVGIGTADPDGKLHVKDFHLISGYTVQTTATGITVQTSGDMTGVLSAGDTVKISGDIYTLTAVNTNNTLTLSSAAPATSSGLSIYVYIDALTVKNGNVGVGTTDPDLKLEVAGSLTSGQAANTRSKVSLQPSNNGNRSLDIYSDGVINSYNTNFPTAGNGGLQFQIAASTHLSIKGGDPALDPTVGNVGIGTTNPGAELEVAGSIKTSNVLSEHYRAGRSDGDVYIQANTANDFVSIGTQTSNNLLRVQGNGNIGIGTTTPEGKLEIYGNGGWASPDLHLKGVSPTIKLNDIHATDDWYIHVNENNFYLLVDRGANGTDDPIDDASNAWETPTPLKLEGDTNKGYLFDNEIYTSANLPPGTTYSAGTGISITGNVISADGIDSSQFLRSDVTDYKTGGNTRYNDNLSLEWGTGKDFGAYFDGTNMYFESYSHNNGNVYFTGEDIMGNREALLHMMCNTSSTYIRLFAGGNERLRTLQAGGVEVYGSVFFSGGETNITSQNIASYIPASTGATTSSGLSDLTISSYSGLIGNWLTGSYKVDWYKVGNLVTLFIDWYPLPGSGACGLNAGGYIGFSGLPFAAAANRQGKYVGTACNNSVSTATHGVLLVQNGMVFLWGLTTGIPGGDRIVGQVTYECV
jgi:hypothetical protein